MTGELELVLKIAGGLTVLSGGSAVVWNLARRAARDEVTDPESKTGLALVKTVNAAIDAHRATCPIREEAAEQVERKTANFIDALKAEAEERKAGRSELRDAIQESERRTSLVLAEIKADVRALASEVAAIRRGGAGR